MWFVFVSIKPIGKAMGGVNPSTLPTFLHTNENGHAHN